MNKPALYILAIIFYGCLVQSHAQTLGKMEIEFDPEKFEFIQTDERELWIKTAGTEYFYDGDPEHPALPFRNVSVLVPNGAELLDFQFNFDLEIIRQGIILSKNPMIWPVSRELRVSQEKQVIFRGTYPEMVVEYTSTEKMRGYTYLNFKVSPFIYKAYEESLYLVSNLDLTVEYAHNNKLVTRVHPEETLIQFVKQNFINPGDLEFFYPDKLFSDLKSADSDLDYLIITPNNLKEEFDPLLQWKIRKGVRAEIITLEEIYSLVDGPTEQLKIKTFLNDIYEERNLKWVLMGGDHDIVPIQRCYGKIIHEFEDYTIPTDLFYACFDRQFDWNSEVDNKIGEPFIDHVDWIPEIYISRIPVRTRAHVKTFVNKTLAYELDPPREQFVEKMLLTGVESWNSWNDKSDNHYRNEQMFTVHVANYWQGKKYAFYDTGTDFPGGDEYQVNASNLSSQLNEGYGFFHFSGHGNSHAYVMESGKSFTTGTASELTHAGHGIMLSTTCDVNAFDSEDPCLSESFLRNPKGGCVAFWGSSRYGLDIPNKSANLGPSFLFNAKFLEYLFKGAQEGGTNSFGALTAMAKARLSIYRSNGGAYLYLQYALNAMGDPELPIYTRNPHEFDKVRIYRFGNNLTVNTGLTEGCRICITSLDLNQGFQRVIEDVSYHTFTDFPGSFQVTITRPNFIPYRYVSGFSTGIQTEIDAYVRIYPNPVSEYLKIEIDFRDGQLYLYNQNGVVVQSQVATHGLNTLLMTGHPNGIYILRLVTDFGVGNFKVLKVGH